MSALSSEYTYARYLDCLEEYGDPYLAYTNTQGPEESEIDPYKEEVWRYIEGLPHYQVSSKGRVRSFRLWRRDKNTYPRYLSFYTNKHGHFYVDLAKNDGTKKKCLVHRLVAEAFLPNPEGLPYVCHKDDNPQNNELSNLYWGTAHGNHFDAWANGGYFHKPVYCYETDTTYENAVDAAYDMNVCNSSMSACCHGRVSHVNGYHFCFLNEKEEKMANLDEWIGRDYSPLKAVIATNVSTGEELYFESRKAAAEFLNIPDCGISSAITGRINSTHGWAFRNA